MQRKNGSIGCRQKKAVKTAGNILMILACMFVISKLVQFGGRIEWNAIRHHKWLTVLITLGYTWVILVNPLAYKNLLKITTGTSVPFYKVQHLCCKTNLYKYLPGNIFQYVGRNQIAVDQNMGHAEVAGATILEIVFTIFASLLASFIFAGDLAVLWIKANITMELCMAVFVIVCLFILFGFLFRKRLYIAIGRIFQLLSVRGIAGMLAAAVWIFLMLAANAFLFSCVFRITGNGLNQTEIHRVMGVFMLSFCIGYIMPGVPGGIGIRETMLLVFMGQAVSEVQVVAAAVLFRIISITGDVLAYGLSALTGLRAEGRK